MGRSVSGFTLIEVVAILLLLGIVAVTIPTCVRPSSAKVRAEADILGATLRYVQSRAIAEERLWRLEFTSGTEYRIGPAGGAWARIPGSGGDRHVLAAGQSGPSGWRVYFDGWGRPVESDGTVQSSERGMVLNGSGIDNNFRLSVVPETGHIEGPTQYAYD